ncbi:MAG: PQQ-dependent sugar dehydrogenase [Pseudomonadota bacterium]
MKAFNAAYLLIFSAVLLGCQAIQGFDERVGSAPKKTVVLDGLRSPWSLAFIDEYTVLITEKEGGLVLADLQTGRVQPIRGLPDDLVADVRVETNSDNGGLFDLVLHPSFPKSPWLYLSYAAQSTEGRTTKVVRAKLSGTSLFEIETLLVAKPYTKGEFFHYGGGLVFGQDDRLYITVGERIFNETSNPAVPIAQDPLDRRGKIYRLNADGSVPSDNPDFGDGAAEGLYAIGIRAAQGLTLHPQTGEVWFSEHGSRQGDEINRLIAGANYGWPIVTDGGYRDADYVPPQRSAENYEPPVWSWKQTVAPTGLTFYYGSAFPDWRGDLLVAGLSRGNLWRLNFVDDEIVSVEELFVNDRVRSRKVAVSPSGVLYLLTDTLIRVADDGSLEFSGKPSGQLIRIDNHQTEKAK